MFNPFNKSAKANLPKKFNPNTIKEQKETKIMRGFFKDHLERIKNVPQVGGPETFSFCNDPVFGIDFTDALSTKKPKASVKYYPSIKLLGPEFKEFSDSDFIWFWSGRFCGDGCFYYNEGSGGHGSLSLAGSVMEGMDLAYYSERLNLGAGFLSSGTLKPDQSSFFTA